MGKFEFEFQDSCVKNLEDSLYLGPIILSDGQEVRRLEEKLIDRIGGLSIIIHADEHSPPHFLVKFNEESNSFKIDDGSPMYPNGLKNYFVNIKKWHATNKGKLIEAWNNFRPTDCPVGKI